MTVHIKKELIIKTVKNSQKIEGYKSADNETIEKAKKVMAKFDVKVSL